MISTRNLEQLILFSNSRKVFNAPKDAHTHVEGFNSLLKYLVRLRGDGTLEDDDFGELVKLASAAFVEAEIAEKVENFLENKKMDEYLLGLWK